MTGWETEKGGTFKTGAPVPGLANLTGLLDQLRAVRLALLAVGLGGQSRKAKKSQGQENELHAFGLRLVAGEVKPQVSI